MYRTCSYDCQNAAFDVIPYGVKWNMFFFFFLSVRLLSQCKGDNCHSKFSHSNMHCKFKLRCRYVIHCFDTSLTLGASMCICCLCLASFGMCDCMRYSVYFSLC